MSESKPNSDKRDLIEGLIKGLDVLSAFDETSPNLTPSEVAKKLNISRAAARRYLITLTHTGYAESDGKTYHLTPKVLALSHAYSGSARLPNTVLPYLQKASRDLQFSCNCAVLEVNDAVYVCNVNVQRLISTSLSAGTRLPAYTATAGRVLLSALPDEKLREWIANNRLVRFTDYTTTDPEKLFNEIITIRERGYDFTENLFELGLRGISVGLVNRQGEMRAAIGVSMSSSACSRQEALVRCLPVLQATARALIPLI
jgi:IclR family transcriptional regulator, pca regulon regulatory protein